MDKMIVTVFDNESQAYEASQALRDLHFEGSVLVYSGAVISKDADGNVQLRAIDDEGPIGTAVGMAFGSLFGAVAGGPIGMLAGTEIGGWTGLFADAYNYDRGTEFVSEVANRLDEGKCALVIQVDEGWTAPVNARLEEIGGQVYRRDLERVEAEQWLREIEAEERALEQLEAELEQASDETRAELQAKVDAARTRLENTHANMKAKYEAFKAETQAKVEVVEDRIQTASEEAKAKLEERKSKIEADFQACATRIKEKLADAKQALTN